MLNKKIWLRSILFISCLVGVSGSFVSAVSLNIDLGNKPIQAISPDAILKNIMPVYFADNGNDFGGFLYLSNGSGAGTYTLGVLGTNSIFECSSQVKGFYYNAERGERLWPLDAQTFSGINYELETTGGIYTMCVSTGYNEALIKCKNGIYEKCRNCEYNKCVDEVRDNFESDGFGYYGSLTHNYQGKEYNLTVGVKYKKDNSDPFYKMDPKSGFAPTFVRLENKYPIGFIYDYNGGVGLAGCKCDSGKMAKILEHGSGDITEVFMYSGSYEKIVDKKGLGIDCNGTGISVEDIVKIIIEGVVGLDDRSGPKFGGLGNSSDTKMQYFGTKSVSNVALMNYATKKAESLCRGKWGEVSTNKSKNEIYYCIQANDGTIDANDYLGSTLIVKGGANVKVSPNKGNINVFIDSGNLIIEEGNDTTGYVFTTGGVVLENTSLVNTFSGAVKAYGSDYKGTHAGVASLIKGNFIVNGNVVGSGNGDKTLKKKYFIYGKFMTKDDITQLENVFSWRCDNGFGSDGNFCPRFEGNPYSNAALVVIDKNDGNFPLFES